MNYYIRSVAWASRHFAMASCTALKFRDEGNIPAARRFARYAREDWRQLNSAIKRAESEIK